MNVFVSYARRDNDVTALRKIEKLISPYGTPYIDDLHHLRYGGDRHEAVGAAFLGSSAFVAVLSPGYLRTPWTRKEFQWAVDNEMPMLALMANAHFIPIDREMKERLLNHPAVEIAA